MKCCLCRKVDLTDGDGICCPPCRRYVLSRPSDEDRAIIEDTDVDEEVDRE